MIHKKIVSIIIPIFNQEKYISRCLNSLINQSFSDIEIIAVNDGSEDKSSEIIEEMSLQDNRIVAINKNNGGVIDAVCCGIRNASGEYICFVDPDDYVGKNYIENFINSIGDNDFIAMGFFFDRKNSISPQKLNENLTYDYKVLSEMCRYFPLSRRGSSSNKDFFAAKWNKMYKASLIKKIVEQYSLFKGLSLGEDVLFTYLVLKNSSQAKTLVEPNSYFYNVSNPDSMMSSFKKVSDNIDKSNKAFLCFNELCDSYNDNFNQSYFLYYLLFRTNVNNAKKGGKSSLIPTLKYYKSDAVYKKSIKFIWKRLSFKERITSFLFWLLGPNFYCKLSLRKK